MRFPFLPSPDQLMTAWRQMSAQYERDYEALEPHVVDITLTTSTTTTTISNRKIRPTSAVHLEPKTANAQSEAVFIDTPTQGQVVINHQNNGNTDKIYRMTVLGT